MKLNKLIISAAILPAFISKAALGAGYSSNLTSTSALANSYAGSVTGIHDSSDMFFNPAVTSGILSSEFVASFSYLDLDVDIDNLKLNNAPAGGEEVSDAGEDSLIPAFYYSTRVNDDVAIGLALTVPFGLATKYNQNWGAKDNSLENKIEAYNINPNISYQLDDKIALGFGLQVQYMKSAFLKNPGTVAKTYAQDLGYGYNLGLKYKIDDNINFGLGYRSKIDHKFKGYTRVSSIKLREIVNYKLTTPESLTAGLSGNVNSKTQLAFDVTWNRWSRLNQVNFSYPSNVINDENNDFKWNDSFMYSLGLNYDYNNQLNLRSGIAYEEDGVSDSYRGFVVPTGDRIWTSVGLNYQLKEDLAFDLTYLHQFHSKEKIESNADQGYSADSKTSVNVLSVGLVKQF